MRSFWGLIKNGDKESSSPSVGGNSWLQSSESAWRSVYGDLELNAPGYAGAVGVDGEILTLVRGYAVRPRDQYPPASREIAQWIGRYYRERGSLPTDGLEGSFTICVFDSRQSRVLVYRNLVGSGFTYYAAANNRFLFGSNLAHLARQLDTIAPNQEALPGFFLYRFAAGRETLLSGVHRLGPGELLKFDCDGLSVTQHQSIADLMDSPVSDSDAVDRLEETMGRVVADLAAIDPEAVNLLSGGVDSSFIQAHWNRTVECAPRCRRTAVVTVDHPRTAGDLLYARTAAVHFRTEHREYPANGPFAACLIDAIQSTGEPPNHAQSAYFGHLAQDLSLHSTHTALCGEGADSLFGTDYVGMMARAWSMRKLLPSRALRFCAGQVAEVFGKGYTHACCKLAEHIEDRTHPSHPVNQIAAFAEWDLVEQCFGREAIANACRYRHTMLERLSVPQEPLTFVHAAGYFGEAVETASLWATLFDTAGVTLLFPFLDSRILRVAVNIAPNHRFSPSCTKWLVKEALSRHVPAEFVHRPKMAFGQPVFEWLGPTGALRPLMEMIRRCEFIPEVVLTRAKRKPGWFLYNLLCYDLWMKLIVEQSDVSCVEARSA